MAAGDESRVSTVNFHVGICMQVRYGQRALRPSVEGWASSVIQANTWAPLEFLTFRHLVSGGLGIRLPLLKGDLESLDLEQGLLTVSECLPLSPAWELGLRLCIWHVQPLQIQSTGRWLKGTVVVLTIHTTAYWSKYSPRKLDTWGPESPQPEGIQMYFSHLPGKCPNPWVVE